MRAVASWRTDASGSRGTRQRKLRNLADATALALGAAVAAFLVLVGSLQWTPRTVASRDLLANARWHGSSSYRTYLAPAMFFHTDQEASPSLTYVLPEISEMSELAVRNSDLYPERAVPLVAEVSVDGVSFHEVARVSDVFTWWRPRFPRQPVKHLRLRASGTTWLHLREVHGYH